MASAPLPASAKAKAEAETAKTKAATEAAKPAKAAGTKPRAQARKAAPAVAVVPKASGGHVVRLVAEDKPGEFVLSVQTNKAPAHFEKRFLSDPPRMVLDLSGAWTYSGPLSRETGKDFIRRIRVGRHADMFRVVLDLAPDALSRFRGVPTAQAGPGGVTLRIPK
jgi:hypothetical protein